MDFKSPPARITTVRQSGAFAAGNALSMTAALKPLDPAPVKEVRLDATHKIIEISPGVKFAGWTFGDQVPGPTVRARVGDKIRFTMTNRSDEPVPGVRVTTAPMMHSMDFHAAMVSPRDKYRSIAPGQTIEFEFTLNYPGIFMYHCGTPMVLEHIASGMYGAVIVEPRAGFPTKVDREYVIIQSEFYARPDPDKRKVDGAPLYVLDGDRLRAAQPTHTVFNGVHNGMVKQPLPAKAGERVRLHVLNVGPSKTSSFHVVGTIFDRVWIEGNPGNQLRGMQTVLLGSSNSATVEFMIPEDGSYMMVDHHFANASQGAIGLISTVKADVAELEHHNLPASATPTEPEAALGKLHFESKCVACHSVGQGRKLGPDMVGVTKRRTDDWLTRWLGAPEKMLESDPDAKAMLKEYNSLPMGTLYTIGHSTRTTRQLVDLLRAHGVEQVVDVRTIPKSRHNPQFNRPALSRALHAVKIGYRHVKALGGLRHARPDSVNLGWRNARLHDLARWVAHGAVTVVYGARDQQHSDAAVIRDEIARRRRTRNRPIRLARPE